jgi:hypothetical protein
MWQGRCGNPAHLIVDALVPIGDTVEPMSWLCCDAARCMQAARWHADAFNLRYLGCRRITPADIEAITRREAVAA